MQHKHIEKIGKSPHEIDNNDPNKNINGNGALNEFVNIVE